MAEPEGDIHSSDDDAAAGGGGAAPTGSTTSVSHGAKLRGRLSAREEALADDKWIVLCQTCHCALMDEEVEHRECPACKAWRDDTGDDGLLQSYFANRKWLVKHCNDHIRTEVGSKLFTDHLCVRAFCDTFVPINPNYSGFITHNRLTSNSKRTRAWKTSPTAEDPYAHDKNLWNEVHRRMDTKPNLRQICENGARAMRDKWAAAISIMGTASTEPSQKRPSAKKRKSTEDDDKETDEAVPVDQDFNTIDAAGKLATRNQAIFLVGNGWKMVVARGPEGPDLDPNQPSPEPSHPELSIEPVSISSYFPNAASIKSDMISLLKVSGCQTFVELFDLLSGIPCLRQILNVAGADITDALGSDDNDVDVRGTPLDPSKVRNPHCALESCFFMAKNVCDAKIAVDRDRERLLQLNNAQEETLSSLNNRISGLETTIGQGTSVMAERDAQISQGLAELHALNAEIDKLRAGATEQAGAVETLTERNGDMEKEVQELREYKNSAEAKGSELQRKVTTLEAQLVQGNDTIQKLRSEVGEVTKQSNAELLALDNTNTQKLTQQASDLENSKRKVDSLQQELNACLQEVQRASQVTQEVTKKRTDAHARELSDMKAAAMASESDIRIQNRTLTDELGELKQSSELRVGQLIVKLQSSATSLEESRAERASLAKQKEEADDERKKYKLWYEGATVDHAAEKKRLEDDNEQLTNDMEQLRQEHAEALLAQRNETAQLLTEHQRVRVELQARIESSKLDYQQRSTTEANATAVLQEELSAVKLDHRTVKAALSDYKATTVKQLEDANAHIRTLTTQLQETTDSSRRLADEHDATLEETRQELKTATDALVSEREKLRVVLEEQNRSNREIDESRDLQLKTEANNREKEERIATRTAELTACNVENQRMTQQLVEKDRQLAAGQLQLNELTTSREELRSAVAESKTTYQGMVAANAALRQTTNEEISLAKAQCREQLSQLEGSLREHNRADKERLEAELKAVRDETNDRITNGNRKVQSLEDTERSLRAENISLKSQLTSETESLQRIQQLLDSKNAENMAQGDAKMQECQHKLQEYEVSETGLRQKIHVLEGELRSAEYARSQLDAASSTIQTLQTDLEQSNSRCDKQKLDVDLSKNALTERDKQITDNRTTIATLEDTLRNRDVELTELRRNVQQQERAFQDKNTEAQLSQEAQRRLEATYDKLKEEATTKESDNEAKRVQIEGLENAVAKLTAQGETELNARITGALEKITQLETAAAGQSDALKNSAEKEAEIQSTLEQRNSENATLTNELDTANGQIAVLRKTNADLELVRDSLASANREQTTINNELVVNLRAQIDGLRQKDDDDDGPPKDANPALERALRVCTEEKAVMQQREAEARVQTADMERRHGEHTSGLERELRVCTEEKAVMQQRETTAREEIAVMERRYVTDTEALKSQLHACNTEKTVIEQREAEARDTIAGMRRRHGEHTAAMEAALLDQENKIESMDKREIAQDARLAKMMQSEDTERQKNIQIEKRLEECNRRIQEDDQSQGILRRQVSQATERLHEEQEANKKFAVECRDYMRTIAAEHKEEKGRLLETAAREKQNLRNELEANIRNFGAAVIPSGAPQQQYPHPPSLQSPHRPRQQQPPYYPQNQYEEDSALMGRIRELERQNSDLRYSLAENDDGEGEWQHHKRRDSQQRERKLRDPVQLPRHVPRRPKQDPDSSSGEESDANTVNTDGGGSDDGKSERLSPPPRRLRGGSHDKDGPQAVLATAQSAMISQLNAEIKKLTEANIAIEARVAEVGSAAEREKLNEMVMQRLDAAKAASEEHLKVELKRRDSDIEELRAASAKNADEAHGVQQMDQELRDAKMTIDELRNEILTMQATNSLSFEQRSHQPTLSSDESVASGEFGGEGLQQQQRQQQADELTACKRKLQELINENERLTDIITKNAAEKAHTMVTSMELQRTLNSCRHELQTVKQSLAAATGENAPPSDDTLLLSPPSGSNDMALTAVDSNNDGGTLLLSQSSNSDMQLTSFNSIKGESDGGTQGDEERQRDSNGEIEPGQEVVPASLLSSGDSDTGGFDGTAPTGGSRQPLPFSGEETELASCRTELAALGKENRILTAAVEKAEVNANRNKEEVDKLRKELTTCRQNLKQAQSALQEALSRGGGGGGEVGGHCQNCINNADIAFNRKTRLERDYATLQAACQEHMERCDCRRTNPGHISLGTIERRRRHRPLINRGRDDY